MSVNTNTGMATIYWTTANVRKDGAYLVISASLHAPNTIISIDKKGHAFKKRLLAQVFNNPALKGIENRIFLSIGFGMSWSIRPFVDNDQTRQWHLCQVALHSLWRYKLDHIFFASLLSPIKTFGACIRQQFKAPIRLGNHFSQKACFHFMLNVKDPKTGHPFSEREVWTGSLQLIVAGSDTIAVAMSAAIFCLVHNRESLSKVTEEIRSCFKEEKDIRIGNQLNFCAFLRACITEAL
ncbi:unnamed protein product [Penicillium salamii]|nr:unnamed protein product [Penicillium salamii]CAG8377541.1 unnamed protein product [Penicillium salamii]